MPRRTAEGSSSSPSGATGLMESGSAAGPVDLRPGAEISPHMVNVFEQAVSPGAAPGLHLVPLGGRPAGDAIALSVLAWVRNVAYDKDVWMDLFVLDDDGNLLHSETVPLAYQEPAEGGGDFFAVGAAVPAPKSSADGPEQRTLQFRVYGQMNGQLYTDGHLHGHRVESTPAKKAAAKPTAPKAAAPKAATKAAAPKAAPKAAAPAETVAETPAPKAAAKPRKPRTPKA